MRNLVRLPGFEPETSCAPSGVDTLRRNMASHELLAHGFELPIELPPGHKAHRHIYAVDWENVGDNDILVVDQFPIQGKNDRRAPW
jgi:type I restriction enzyme, R subunit